MTVAPRRRRRASRLLLTLHVVSSVGWLGAVAASVALAVTALVSPDRATVAAMELTLEVLGWSVLVPGSLAALTTGVTAALRSKWGLLRHYWVIVKLVLTVIATGVLLLYMRTLDALAALVRATPDGEWAPRTPSPLVHAAAALLVLLGATVLSIYKPIGTTRLTPARAAGEPGYGGSRVERH